jgi:hypothetical protein
MGLAHTLRVNPALGLVRAPLRSAARCSGCSLLRCCSWLLTDGAAARRDQQTSVQDLESRYHHFGSNMHEKVRRLASPLALAELCRSRLVAGLTHSLHCGVRLSSHTGAYPWAVVVDLPRDA